MKKHLFQFAITLTFLSAFSQNPNDKVLTDYLQKINGYKGFALEVQYCKKDLFETDTVCKQVKINYIKPVADICPTYLQIVDEQSGLELLLLNDTSWSINHRTQTIQRIGGKTEAKGHSLFPCFPLNALLIEPSILQQEPYWHYLEAKGTIQPVQFDVNVQDKEVTSIDLILYIDTLSQQCVKQLLRADFGQWGFQLQTLYLAGLHEFDSMPKTKPAFFHAYQHVEKDTMVMAEVKTREAADNITIDTMHFVRLEGGDFILPDDGYIFLDFWYVGCFYCMKAAPTIDELYHEYGDRIHFFSVNDLDTDLAKIKHFKTKMNIRLPVLLYHRQVFSQLLNNNGYPRFLILEAKSGNILWKQFGHVPGLKSEVDIIFKSILNL